MKLFGKKSYRIIEHVSKTHYRIPEEYRGRPLLCAHCGRNISTKIYYCPECESFYCPECAVSGPGGCTCPECSQLVFLKTAR